MILLLVPFYRISLTQWNYAKIMKIINLDSIDKKSISNIVFDWGGVITNIEFRATVKAFQDIGLTSFENIFTSIPENDFFDKLERGFIEPKEFYHELRRFFSKKISNAQLKEAWCKMLLDTPIQRIELLKKLGENFSIYLLSNTNKIHADFYNDFLKQCYSINYKTLFQKVYYSYELGMRKPERGIFEYIVHENDLNPLQTLFIDDTEINVDIASSVGIISLFLTKEYTIENFFKKWVD